MTTSVPPRNLLLILSDEHNPGVLGCAGHPEIQTPHLDSLAAGGINFTNATCASPICVPSRAALATGRNIYETGYWDNVDAYDGRTTAWHRILRDAGHEVVSIGKLHYRGWEGDDYGFTESLMPMHIHGGRGEVKMLLRDPPASLGDGSGLLASAKAGRSDYNEYDAGITQRAIQWLQERSRSPQTDKPWVLMVSLVAPHFPLTAPEKFFNMYRGRPLNMPKAYCFGVATSAHPFLQQYARTSGYNLHFRNEDDVRRALSGYYGLVSYLDSNVGALLHCLKQTGLDKGTRVLYTSDHGDNTGARGLWGKSTMYRESVGVPMMLSGPEVPAGHSVKAAVSHIDVYNTVLDAVGLNAGATTASPHAASLLGPLDPDRVTLSEYHTIGSKSAVFMVQDAHTKYVHYCDLPAQLFDLESDPQELNNLADRPEHSERVAFWEARLQSLCNPDVADQRAKQRQKQLIEFYGGEETIRNAKGIGGYTPSPSQ